MIRAARRPRAGRASACLTLALLGGAQAACRDEREASLGPPESFVFLRPVSGAATGDLPSMEKLDPLSPELAPIARLLFDGFPAELLRAIYAEEQLVRALEVEGRRYADSVRRRPREAMALVVPGTPTVAREGPLGHGLRLVARFGAPWPRPDVPWVALPADADRDRALPQTLAARLATYAMHLLGTGGDPSVADPIPPVLADGYRMAMEVIAREWRVGQGPAGRIPDDAGTSTQRELMAAVRANRFVLDANGAAPRAATELLADPGVAATVIYRMAQARDVARRPAADAFYEPIAAGRFPPDVSPAAALGPLRNLQAKLMGAWARAILRDRAPRDIVDLIDMYAETFPDERPAVLQIFIATTFGETMRVAGEPRARIADAAATAKQVAAWVAAATAGRRDLRGGVAGRHGERP